MHDLTSIPRRALIFTCSVVLTACVSLETHDETVAKLEKARKVLTQAGDEIKSLKDERSRLAKETEDLKKRLADLEGTADQLRTLDEKMAGLQKDLEAAERERAARDAQIQELTRARTDLAKSLESEIAKQDAAIRLIRDQLAVTMSEQVVFNSGQTTLSPDGQKLLKQLAETLKTVSDKHIRIEGHTDSKGIGPKLRERYPTNWELSTARAASVVRYLVQEGGLGRENLTAVGYADTRPVAPNDTKAGRKANRRIEIVLFPKTLSPPAATISTAPGSNGR
jgi:chemotaxis protein MotB